MAQPTTLEERIRICDWAQTGRTNKEIATMINRSIYTVRKWRRRAKHAGRQALASSKGRPRQGALSSFPEAMRCCLLQWRRDHPGWGPKTLRTELAKHPAFARQQLPNRSSIARLLKQEGLTRRYEPHSRLPESKVPPITAPHQRWQMDARGNEQIADLGTIALINLNDPYTRMRLLSYPCALARPQSHPTTALYQGVLRLALTTWGRPRQLQVDHESVFFDNKTKSPYPTRLHLWLLALDVELVFSRKGRPTDQAVTERSHQLWQSQVLQGQCFRSWQQLFEALQGRRDFLNEDLPCASLAERAPLEVFPEARHSGRPYRPEVEAQLLDLGRLDAYLAQGRWFRLASKDATVRLGGYVYYVGVKQKRTQLEIIYEAATRQLVFRDEAGAVVTQRPIKGLDRKTLMGTLEPYVTLPFFQLSFPFTWVEQEEVRLYETMGVRVNET